MKIKKDLDTYVIDFDNVVAINISAWEASNIKVKLVLTDKDTQRLARLIDTIKDINLKE